MQLLSLHSAAKKYGIGSTLLRTWADKEFVRAIPIERANAKKGITYKFIPDQLEEDINNLSSIEIQRPVLFIDVKESIKRMFK